MDRRQAIAVGGALPDHAHGAVLFADISGFTSLAEGLVHAIGPRRAAEELIRCLNGVYEALIGEVHSRSGSVIGFAGDAITCWFDGDSGAQAVAASLAMQSALRRIGPMAVPDAEAVTLTAKIAVAAGPVRRFVVGNPEHVRVDILAGATVGAVAAGEHLAERGEVVLAEPADDDVLAGLTITGWRVDHDSGLRFACVSGAAADLPATPWPPLADTAIPPDTVRPWVLPPVFERLTAGHQSFQAELRPAVALFLSFGGIAYDDDPNAPSRLDEYVRWVQEILTRYDGHTIQITVGDKGSYMYASFGALVAHDDDASRAIAAALDIQAIPERLQYITNVRIGVSAGRVFSGAYGSTDCRTYGVQGDSVNLAARLMQAAPPGGVLVNAGARRAADRAFLWEALPPITVKNKAQPVAIFRPTGRVARRTATLIEPSYALPIVGRERERAEIDAAMQRSLRGQGSVVAVVADAGMGKSRLVADVLTRWRESGRTALVGACESYAVQDSYHVWHGLLRSFFGLDDVVSHEEQIDALTQRVAHIDPALRARVPLLAPALNLAIPKNDLTLSLDARLRKASLEALIIDCLRAEARQTPLLLVLEDCHWIDPLSRDLLEGVARVVSGLPILILIALRPGAEEAGGVRLARLSRATVVELDSLSQAESERLIALKLAQITGDDAPLPVRTAERLSSLAEGNPFFIEELLHYVRDRGLDPRDEDAMASLDLPSSLDSLILSRIDTLTESQKVVLRIASIIGRQFPLGWVVGIHPGRAADAIREDLTVLSKLDLTPLDQPEPEHVYLFRHMVTRDVAYESVPFATRTYYHEQLGHFLEATEPGRLDQYVDLLAYHFGLSNNVPKKREYLLRAGRAAQTTYANETAVGYFRRLLPLLRGSDRGAVLLELGRVLELVGEWSHASDAYREAEDLAAAADDQSSLATCRRAIGWLLRKQGEYHEAMLRLTDARAGFEGVNDAAAVSQVTTDIGEIVRQLGDFTEARRWYDEALSLATTVRDRDAALRARAQALKGAGTLAAQGGDNTTARALFEESLALRRELNDRQGTAALLSNLGVVAYYAGDYAAARSLDEEGLGVFREIGDLWSTATLLNNLGDIARDMADYDAARQLLEESLRVRRQLGDIGGIAFSLNSLGDLLLDQGDIEAASPVLRESLQINAQLGDRAAMAFLLDDFAALHAAQGRPLDAIQLAGAAAAARDEIGSQLSPGERARFDRLQAPAWASVHASTAEHAWRAGRATPLQAAVNALIEPAQETVRSPV
jgi:class 3 adenylate cyclase/tetratricopeptide (TPR) repeat protein